MAYPIFVAENMQSTVDGSKLRSGRFQTAGTDAIVNNGGLVMLDGTVTSNRDLHKCKVPTAITTTNLYILDGSELVYSEETTKGLDDFRNLAGQNVGLRRPVVGDEFSISSAGITPITTEAAIAVGSFLIPTAGAVIPVEVAAAGGTESFVAEIVDTYTMGYDAIGGRAITMFGCVVTKVV